MQLTTLLSLVPILSTALAGCLHLKGNMYYDPIPGDFMTVDTFTEDGAVRCQGSVRIRGANRDTEWSIPCNNNYWLKLSNNGQRATYQIGNPSKSVTWTQPHSATDVGFVCYEQLKLKCSVYEFDHWQWC